MTATLTLTALAAYAVGYLARAIRPCRRTERWAYRATRNHTRQHPAWWAAQLVFAVSIAVAFVINPAHVIRTFRRRNTPPDLGPPIEIRDFTARDTATGEQQ